MNEDDFRKLQKFDGDARFGPALGLQRMDRWKRAERLGLNPPQDVHDLLVRFAAQEAKIKPFSNGKGYEGPARR